MTPQELMDLPYAGMAENQLRKQADWDASKIIDGVSEYDFTVKIKGYYEPEIEYQTHSVVAKSEKEAIQKAESLCDFDEIQKCAIDEVKEKK